MEICEKCKNESNKVDSYCFYYGKVKSKYNSYVDSRTTKTTTTYELYAPVYTFICNKCILKDRLKWLKWFIILFIIELIIVLAYSNYILYLKKVSGLLGSLIVIIFFPMMAFLLLSFRSRVIIGDQFALDIYKKSYQRKGYDSFFRRDERSRLKQ
jgi:hypothetical protein